VQDVDYVDYEDGSTGSAGGNDEAVDKTGMTKDGPDGDAVASAYLSDTAVASQIPAPSHAGGSSLGRTDVSTESSETSSGGNGITGHDETSEDMYAAFAVETPPTPGAPVAGAGVRDWELY